MSNNQWTRYLRPELQEKILLAKATDATHWMLWLFDQKEFKEFLDRNKDWGDPFEIMRKVKFADDALQDYFRNGVSE